MRGIRWVAVAGLLAMVATGGAAEGARKKAAEGTFRYVESRIFDGVRYDGRKRELTLLFDTGAAYVYRDVPREVYVDFTRIVNKGEYFSRRIRKVYSGERLDAYPAGWCARD